tara:strand:- start:571 stop:1266 length:696 start_codon:yes stop_codon:yes gene_type:complete
MQRPTHTYTDDTGQTIDFTVPEPHTKICMNISGGADSAILLWMLINYCEEHIPDAEIHVITSANPIKGWYNAKWSTSVLDRILQITKTTLIKSHYTFYSTDQIRSELDDTEKMVQRLHGITFTVHGTNQNPPLDIKFDTINNRHKPRDPGHGRPTLYESAPGITRWMPVMGVDKRMIAHLYNHFNMMEELLPYTRSCEQHAEENTDQPSWMVTHCGKCWWCKEREWAFGRY